MENLVVRDIFEEISQHLHEEEISVIIGPRQVGKTTLLRQLKQQLLKEGVSEQRVRIFNLDVETDRRVFADQTTFLEYLRAEAGAEKLFIFADEVQRLANPGLFFKGVYDTQLPVKLVLTGSSALEIRSRIHEALTGRKRVFLLEPFSFREYLRAIQPDLVRWVDASNLTQVHQQELLAAYKRFLIFGGYPKIVLADTTEKKRQMLNELYQSYIEKDVVGFLRLGNPASFTKCLAALAHQIGGLVNVQELSTTLGIARTTVERYLSVLEQTFILFPAQPHYTNPRTELKKMQKWYFRDIGLRNFIAENMQQWELRRDQGMLLENAVAHEMVQALTPPARLHFWRTKTKAEVDFVIPATPPIPLEVKQTTRGKLWPTRAFQSFAERYDSRRGYVVSLSEEGTQEAQRCTLHFVLPWRVGAAIREMISIV